MSSHTTEEPAANLGSASAGRGAPRVLALVVAWAAGEPHRAGDVALLPPRREPYVLGRGGGETPDAARTRVVFARQRPGEILPTEPLSSRAISRDQVEIVADPQHLRVRRIGRCPMSVNGVSSDDASVSPGDTLTLRGQLVCLCISRVAMMPAARYAASPSPEPFGEADALGIVGESEVVWHLRDDLAFAAKAAAHVLLTGQSGTGKELAARAIHSLSPRAGRRFIARNAATFPTTLIDAELFGNAGNYPNPGTPERAGLIGEADGGTLFLDEIGELPVDLQAHLLRVLDERGEYQRLGEATPRHADVRLIGATNRAPDALKTDLLARFAVRLELPPCDARREDLPLLLRHLALAAAKKSPDIAGRFVLCGAGGRLDVRMHPEFVERALRESHPTNVRDLEAALWRAMRESDGDFIGHAGDALPTSNARGDESPGPTLEDLRSTLAAAEGNLSKAARALGLPSRYALYRLMKKHGIDVSALREHDEG